MEWLLGISPAALREGSLAFHGPSGWPVIAGCLAAVIVAAWLLYRRTTVAVPRPLKWGLMLLRGLVLAVLCWCLLRPVLRTPQIIPRQSYLAVLVDDSRSMSIRDNPNKQSRGDVVADMLYGDDRLLDELNENFRLRVYRFGADARRITSADDLQSGEIRTDLTGSIEQVAEQMQGLPVTGLVVLTDGGDNGSADPVRSAEMLGHREIPVFTVGVGRQRMPGDYQITQVSASRTVMEGSIFDVHVTVRSEGFRERNIALQIFDGDRMVTSKQVTLDEAGGIGRFTLELTPEREGRIVYTVRIPEHPDEIITENNSRSFLVDNRKERADILYIEGHPQNEYKFLRRAVADDPTLRVATYLQTAPHKYLRQGIESPDELLDGYPTDAAELYQYEAVIFGDIPPDFFSPEQLALTNDFVSKRGGGFLMIGGSSGFDEGYIDTPVDKLLPVSLVRERSLPNQLQGGAKQGHHPTGREFTMQLTPDGAQESMLRLAVDGASNRRQWQALPELRGINVTGHPKAGAIVLAEHPLLRYQGAPLPLMAFQRFGRGRSLAVMTASTWRWQMLMPSEDLSHERLWRQVLRWLASSSPSPVSITLDRETYAAGENVQVRVTVADSAYAPVNDAAVWLQVERPSGALEEQAMEWAIQDDGVYTGTFPVNENGIFALEVDASNADGKIGVNRTALLVTESNREFTDPGMDADLLAGMAEVSDGKYYIPANVDNLSDDLAHIPNSYSVDRDVDLWDSPAIFLLLLGAFCMEWSLRRRKGMS